MLQETTTNATKAEHYGKKFSVVILGFVVTTLADPRAIASNRIFGSSPRVKNVINQMQVNANKFLGDLTFIFGYVQSHSRLSMPTPLRSDKVLNGMRGDYTDKGIAHVLSLPAIAQRAHMLPALGAFQSL